MTSNVSDNYREREHMPLINELNINCSACKCVLILKLSSDRIKCPSCQQIYIAKDGVFDLRLDPSMNTLLDIDSYDSAHGVSGVAASVELWEYYEKILKSVGVPLNGRALEIASGSGHLSLGLVGNSNFELVVLSDISPDFIRLLQNKLRINFPVTKSFVAPFLFDANNIPFSENQFDLVIGNMTCLVLSDHFHLET